MRLVDASHVSDEEMRMQQALANYPELRERLLYLFSGYRDLLDQCKDALCQVGIDTADAQKAMLKRDNALRRLGLLRE